jgi:hypothetical protein
MRSIMLGRRAHGISGEGSSTGVAVAPVGRKKCQVDCWKSNFQGPQCQRPDLCGHAKCMAFLHGEQEMILLFSPLLPSLSYYTKKKKNKKTLPIKKKPCQYLKQNAC